MRFLSCGLLLCGLLIVGCGSDDLGPALYPVSGQVTFDGAPVESGRIQFRRVDGDQRAYSAEIVQGEYSVEAEAGAMQVEITASRLIPGKFDTSNGTPEPVGEMYIPAKYNSQTTLTAEVKSESNDLPFALTTN